MLESVGWDEEFFSSYEDFLVLPLFALFFPIVRFLLDIFVFENLGRRLMFLKGEEVDVQRKKISKFKESGWKCVYFLSAEIFALIVTYNEPWFNNTRNFYVGPQYQIWPHLKYKMKLKMLYMYGGGFYVYSIFALIFWETRRSDFGVSMIHHFASFILIALSYIYRFGRVGSVVLALHDASDIFLEIGKMSKYSGAESLASFSFVLFVVSWILLRLTYFPFWILWSTSYEMIEVLDKERSRLDFSILYYVFNCMLFCLLILHIYWGILIYRMVVKQIQAKGHVSEDVRSDSEDEDEHED